MFNEIIIHSYQGQEMVCGVDGLGYVHALSTIIPGSNKEAARKEVIKSL